MIENKLSILIAVRVQHHSDIDNMTSGSWLIIK